MAESAVSFLLEQLSVLLRDETKLLGGLEGEVEYIQGEMMQMKEFLRVADQKEESNPGLKEWVRQLREISYDVEDVLDKFMLRFGRHRGTNGFSGYIRKTYDSVKNLSARRQIATEIQAIKKRLENVSTSQKRYREMYSSVMDQGTGSTIPRTQGNDGRGDALFLDDADVVGIGKSKDQLLEWIGSMDSGLEVISVVGMGGLGKTTLVKKVYDDESVKRRFNGHVWIIASEYKDDKHLLRNLIKNLVAEIKQPPPQELEDMNLQEMRNFVYEFLKKKNYIIVLDDVWDISTWNAIRPPLSKGDVNGCVIITTRDSNIANAACSKSKHVYHLQPLGVEESEMLFYKKAFPRNICPPYLREFAENILKRCGGLPLAIVVIGGLLATKDTAEEWEVFYRSLGYELEGGSLQILPKILSLSYSDLPYYLKYCYLYLSIFPEDYLLEKEKIIRLWIAEGFVQPKQGKTMEEVAADYLNELFSRSLVQVAERHIDGRVRAFRVHDVLRDYILSKSRELNIVTVSREGEMQWPGTIRRFVIHKSFNFSRETNNFKCLRSLILMCSKNVDVGIINELVRRCRLLKVLDLRGAPLKTIPSEVFKLYHLKYLCLRDTMISLIPKSIKYLQNLETLDLKNSYVTELPSEILKLHRLRHLSLYKYKVWHLVLFDHIQSFKAPCDIGSHLPSLVKLSCVDADEKDGIKIVKEIGKLTQLRRLGIAKLRSEDGKDLCSSIANLTQLRSLNIQSIERLELDYPLRLPFLRTLTLFGSLEKLPQWISSLNGLTTLHLYVNRMREDPLMCIQDLPNLTRLGIHGAYVEELSFKAEGFQKLKVLGLGELKFMKGVIVEKGCMPFLEEWNMTDCSMVIELPQGMEHLINLQSVSFIYMTKEFQDKVVESKRNGALAHVPNVAVV